MSLLLKMMIMTMTTIKNKTLFIQPSWPAPLCIKAYTTLRDSEIGYRQSAERVPGNIDRARLNTLLQLPNDPIWLDQVHSTIAVEAIPANNGYKADAVYSNQPNHVCAVLTADCLPVLVCNKQGTQIAAIHAGWRGLANGIIENTLNTLQIPPEDTLVWLGPAIGPSQFQIRKDVYDIFMQQDPNAATALHSISDEHWLVDMYALARSRLQKCHVTEIYGGDRCTYSEHNDFFSYRRDGKIIGSIVSMIWIADSNKNL